DNNRVEHHSAIENSAIENRAIENRVAENIFDYWPPFRAPRLIADARPEPTVVEPDVFDSGLSLPSEIPEAAQLTDIADSPYVSKVTSRIGDAPKSDSDRRAYPRRNSES